MFTHLRVDAGRLVGGAAVVVPRRYVRDRSDRAVQRARLAAKVALVAAYPDVLHGVGAMQEVQVDI